MIRQALKFMVLVGAYLLFRVPLVALVAGALVDRSPSGALRFTMFPLALTCFDPYLWTCAWGSLIVALLSSFGSVAVGTFLAAATRTRSYWGRPILAVSVVLPLAILPAIAARAWRDSGLIGPFIIKDLGGSLFDLTPWLCWLVSSLAWGSALVAIVARSRLDRIDPTAIELSRSLGLTTWSRARLLVWPMIRPAVANAGSLVFSLVLFDPGPALVLGLRRSLAFEVFRSTRLIGGIPRAATISVGTVIVCLIVHHVLFRPGQDTSIVAFKSRPKFRVPLHKWTGIPLVSLLVIWSSLMLYPLWLLLRTTLHAGLSLPDLGMILRVHGGISIFTGTTLGVAAILLGGRAGLLGFRPKGMMIPPLAIGVGMLLLKGFLPDNVASDLGLTSHMLALSTGNLVPILLFMTAMAAAWMPLVRPNADTRIPPFAVSVFVAVLGATSAAPAVVLHLRSDLTILGAQIARISTDSDAFCLLSIIAVALNLIALGSALIQKRSHLGDWLV